jgi:hypothetical protein
MPSTAWRFFAVQIRNRVKELRHVRAGDLRPNPKNWRVHTEEQENALRGVLAEVGYADALLVRELSDEDGALELIDGHLRAETTPDQVVPVLVLDVTEEEADKILATLDPLADMAQTNKTAFEELLGTVRFRSEAVQAMLADLSKAFGDEAGKPAESKPELDISPELFERHDYLVVVFDDEMDWNVACERFGLTTVANAVIDKSSTIRQKGLGRVITAKRLLRELGYG